jgi:hypothetical protein
LQSLLSKKLELTIHMKKLCGILNGELIYEYSTLQRKTKESLFKGYDMTCCVCLRSTRQTRLNRCLLSCGHYYHSTCLRKWLCHAKVCPFCQGPIQPMFCFRLQKSDTKCVVQPIEDAINYFVVFICMLVCVFLFVRVCQELNLD